MADVIVNHISRHSPQFQDFDRLGGESRYAGLFLTCARVFPDGLTEADLIALNGPRPTLPFTKHRNARGEQILLWTTFTSDQIDIDVGHPDGRRYLTAILDRLQSAGVRAIRLDAVGYAIKKAGTSCFMIPETRAFIDDITTRAHERGMDVLVEVHGHYQAQIEVARQVDWVYDFALPPLLLHLIYTRDSRAAASLAGAPAAQRGDRPRYARWDRRCRRRRRSCRPATRPAAGRQHHGAG